MKIYKRKITDNLTFFYFMKSEKEVLMLIYNKKDDFGKHEPNSIQYTIKIDNHGIDKLKELKLTTVRQLPISVVTGLSFLANFKELKKKGNENSSNVNSLVELRERVSSQLDFCKLYDQNSIVTHKQELLIVEEAINIAASYNEY